jgi:hypothetical protein
MPKATVDYKQIAIDCWFILQGADGSRGGMQAALDQAQECIAEEIPDVEDFESDYDTTEDAEDVDAEDLDTEDE